MAQEGVEEEGALMGFEGLGAGDLVLVLAHWGQAEGTVWVDYGMLDLKAGAKVAQRVLEVVPLVVLGR
eukprot:scaffold63944_cov16-Tisochrysis_lutea.AAC.2